MLTTRYRNRSIIEHVKVVPLPPDTDICILCRKDSGYLKSTPIDQRQYYIEGAGQLCRDCFKKAFEGRHR